MRHSDLALVVIRMRINAEPYHVLIKHEKWGTGPSWVGMLNQMRRMNGLALRLESAMKNSLR